MLNNTAAFKKIITAKEFVLNISYRIWQNLKARMQEGQQKAGRPNKVQISSTVHF